MLEILQSVLPLPIAVINHIVYRYTKSITEEYDSAISTNNKLILDTLTIVNYDKTILKLYCLTDYKSNCIKEFIEHTYFGHYPMILEVQDESDDQSLEMSEVIIESIVKKYCSNILSAESSNFTYDVKVCGEEDMSMLYFFVLYKNKIYVIDYLECCIHIYNKNDYKKINKKNMPSLYYPRDIAILNDEIYVTETLLNRILVIDIDTLQIIRTIGRHKPYMLAIQQDKLYCSGQCNNYGQLYSVEIWNRKIEF